MARFYFLSLFISPSFLCFYLFKCVTNMYQFLSYMGPAGRKRISIIFSLALMIPVYLVKGLGLTTIFKTLVLEKVRCQY